MTDQIPKKAKATQTEISDPSPNRDVEAGLPCSIEKTDRGVHYSAPNSSHSNQVSGATVLILRFRRLQLVRIGEIQDRLCEIEKELLSGNEQNEISSDILDDTLNKYGELNLKSWQGMDR
jgi:hypothetical protein